jgi:hypothetical protein
MKYLIGLALVIGLASTGGVAWAAVDDPPPGNTIVDVSGDRDNGFTIERYNGTIYYPPTISEAKAECGEYDTRIARVRCRTQVWVWYRDLGSMKRALDYAHAGG